MASEILPEQWLPVVGFESSYEVSNFGRVRSIDRTVVVERRPGWFVPRRYKGRVLKASIMKTGYAHVVLGHSHDACVHTLVLESFVGPRPEGCYGCHWDGVRSNNALSNLRWASPKENSADACRHNTQIRGTRVPCAVLDESSVAVIRSMAPYSNFVELAALFGVHRVTVRDVVRRVTWTHI